MQKKLIAVAVAGALSAPALALAQASTVQVYGKVIIEYGYADQGNIKPNTDILQTPAGTSIGFKGEEALGRGLAVWFQCESSADVRGINQSGLCGRNSALGMKGDFGSLYLGRWDTPFKRVWLRTVGEGSSTGLLGSSHMVTGFSTSVTPGAINRTLWQRRQSNVLNYDTPRISGFQGLFSFGIPNSTTATSATTNAKPRTLSVAALYDNGPLALGLAYERHNQFGAGAGQDDHAWVLGGSYTFLNNVKVGGVYNRQSYDLGAGLSSTKKAWDLGVQWQIVGPHGLRASYAKAEDISGNGGLIASGSASITPVFAAGPDTGSRWWAIEYTHQFSKRTDGKIGYSRQENDANASYVLEGLSTTGLTAAQANGKTQSAIAVYLRHVF